MLFNTAAVIIALVASTAVATPGYSSSSSSSKKSTTTSSTSKYGGSSSSSKATSSSSKYGGSSSSSKATSSSSKYGGSSSSKASSSSSKYGSSSSKASSSSSKYGGSSSSSKASSSTSKYGSSSSATSSKYGPTPSANPYNGIACTDTTNAYQCYGSAAIGRCVFGVLEVTNCGAGQVCDTDSGTGAAFCGFAGVAYPPTYNPPPVCYGTSDTYACYGGQLGRCVNSALSLTPCPSGTVCQVNSANGAAFCGWASVNYGTSASSSAAASSSSSSYAAPSSSSSAAYAPSSSSSSAAATSSASSSSYVAPASSPVYSSISSVANPYNNQPCTDSTGVFKCYGGMIGRCVSNYLAVVPCAAGTTCNTDPNTGLGFCGLIGVNYGSSSAPSYGASSTSSAAASSSSAAPSYGASSSSSAAASNSSAAPSYGASSSSSAAASSSSAAPSYGASSSSSAAASNSSAAPSYGASSSSSAAASSSTAAPSYGASSSSSVAPASTSSLYNPVTCTDTTGAYACYGSSIGRCVNGVLQVTPCTAGTTCYTDSGNNQGFCGLIGVYYPPSNPTNICYGSQSTYQCYGSQLGRCVNNALQLTDCPSGTTCQVSSANGQAFCGWATAGYSAAASSTSSSSSSSTSSYAAPTSSLTPCYSADSKWSCSSNTLTRCVNGFKQDAPCPSGTVCQIDASTNNAYCGVAGISYGAPSSTSSAPSYKSTY